MADQPSNTSKKNTVDFQPSDLIPEEFPEGPYGSATHEKSLGKSGPWQAKHRPKSAFTYENKEFHAGLPREFPGSHPIHSEASREASNKEEDL